MKYVIGQTGEYRTHRVGYNLRLFLVWFIALSNNISFFFTAVSFIGEGNRSTRRKPPTYRKSLTNL